MHRPCKHLQAAPDLELSIVMPCLNEAETLEGCIAEAQRFLRRSGTKGEVIVADNGSTDGSRRLARALGARVIDVAEKGYGAALRGGIQAARGHFVIMGDSDGSYDFDDLDRFLAKLRAGNDLVMGNRFLGGIERGAMPWLHRFIGNPLLSGVGRLFYGVGVGDFHCGLRGFSKAAIERLGLTSSGMELASEMVVKAAIGNLKIAEVPTVLARDGRSRSPHLRTWRDGWRHLRFLLLHSPRWLFFYPGIALSLLGVFAAGLVSRGGVKVTPTLELGVHTLLVGCFAVLIGVQLIVFSVLARRHCVAEGYLPAPATGASFVLGLTLERILGVAALLLITGIGGVSWTIHYWAGVGFGPITYPLVLNVLVISLTTLTVAIQLGFAGFLASVFSIKSGHEKGRASGSALARSQPAEVTSLKREPDATSGMKQGSA